MSLLNRPAKTALHDAMCDLSDNLNCIWARPTNKTTASIEMDQGRLHKCRCVKTVLQNNTVQLLALCDKRVPSTCLHQINKQSRCHFHLPHAPYEHMPFILCFVAGKQRGGMRKQGALEVFFGDSGSWAAALRGGDGGGASGPAHQRWSAARRRVFRSGRYMLKGPDAAAPRSVA